MMWWTDCKCLAFAKNIKIWRKNINKKKIKSLPSSSYRAEVKFWSHLQSILGIDVVAISCFLSDK